jgi:hypothetical protein
MASRVISVCGQQQFSMLFASGTAIIPIGDRYYDTRDAVAGSLQVRVAGTNVMPPGSSFAVTVTNVLSLPDDPRTFYAASAPALTATIPATDTVFPRLYGAVFGSAVNISIGPQVRLDLKATYGGQLGVGVIWMSVDIVIKDRRA